MRFGFVTDELSADPREAIEMALAWGVRDFEVRNVRGARFPRVADDVLDDLIALRDEYDIAYTAVLPGFFKCFLEDEERIAYALGEGLELTMDFMEACDVPLLICFGFEMAGGSDEEAVERLQALGDRLGERCLGAAVENETHCKFDTPARIAHLLDMVGRPNVGANWDLANLQAGAAVGFPAGYELVKSHIVNVHAKDVRINDNGTAQWRPIGEGICDWPGQVAALLRDGIVEHITIENHCGPLKEVGLQNLRTLEGILAAAGHWGT